MANPPTYTDVADLLDSEERKAKARLAAERAGTNASTDVHMGGTTPGAAPDAPSGREPPRLDRHDDGRFERDRRDRRFSNDRYMNEREENDERRARRAKSITDEDDAPGDSDKASANASERSRRRSRSPRPDSRRVHRSREPRGAGGDYYRGSGRSSFDDDRYRPGDRGGRHPRDYSRERDRDRDRDRRGIGRDGGRDRGPRRPSPHRGTKRKTPEPTDDERDRRTVFVQQLAARLRSRELKDFFQSAGHVVDAQIVKDRVSGRSKGVGYVEFREEESVQKAIQLTGQKLLGIPIIAQLTEAEKNRQARNNEGTTTLSNGVPFHRLYVGNIHFSITEDDLKNVFDPFGELEFVQLQKEETGRSKGYGFVQFINPAQAKEALEKMNGFELAGRPIRVGLGNDKFTAESTNSLLQRFGAQAHHAQMQGTAQLAQVQGSSFSGMGGRGAHAGGTGNFDRPAASREVDKTGGASALDDTDVGGVNFSNYSRDALMRKLARTDEPDQKTAPKTQTKKPVIQQATATRCILIKNMYDQKSETEPNWQKELKEDVKMECEEKYGKVVHIDLALDNNDGEVYVKFEGVQGGENAFKGLNGRWFGGRMLTAQYVVDAVYHMNFPKAASV